ncbi:nuclear transport factor 2 family protein [Corynebacterium sanguinis]|uniref:Nuclear transport factor 2 family protein n=1 Tax=Corynebacterium sanguinis TaxID=2594913 RepID=A0A6C1TZE1_9CORY|nr:nuclear transport factor 2 family protein [Corynebacterium sanguinis]MCT1411844.1 nuclear transport factor 2 family protein [Corynebacterium sanguinis]MCT1443830.1 nuclear transport factor 2 family protein [Corynebacterium sanguinis]MCT1491474.1 nuclear transport factor 2 family protein [Corynebacterium sanguinis]MCT1596402.1 nuclear transport factor 2 family protein [Corynebacterium sanguinis]MCT2246607.1 nuclear transport factor 2 family protein [Corynebacterium sanguinis]
MMFPTGSHKVAATTVALAAASISLTACGSDEETADVASSTSTVTSATTTQSTEPSGTTEATESSAAESSAAQSAANAPGANPQAPAAAGGGLSNPFQDPNFTPPPQQPLQGGSQASDADKQEMEQTMHAALNPPSPEKWTRVLMENSCRKVTEPVQEEMNRSGYTLDQIEQAARLQAQAGQAVTVPQSTVSLTDAKVDGNRASATATVTNQNGSEEQTLIFEREDGRWKLCN